ncbi:MAG TPA: HAMP domain-containing histidine kinase [Clostridiales bacterium]|nr:HAMP domain-containing histidine kinase [Clostridiales bacterium]
MLLKTDNDNIGYFTKNNPEAELAIQNILNENKQNMSIFAHELRNPLSLIKGTLQYIETKHTEVKDYKYWDQIPELIKDMERMISDALALNKLNTLDKTNTNFVNLINSIYNGYAQLALSHGKDLKLTIEPECETYLSSYQCDPARLKQAICNLIQNAFEATVSGDYIHIHLAIVPEEGLSPRNFAMMISNNGLPIHDSELQNIFTPFVTYKKGGTGVGLAVTKKIVELHYGTITVSSNPSATTFTIVLPLE